MIPRGKGLPVLVTGVGGGGHGEQILKALRLSGTGYTIIGTDTSPCSSGLTEVDHPYIVPPASAPHYVDILMRICRRHGVKALFHGSEPELKTLGQNRDVFQGSGIFLPINPARVLDICMDKHRTMSFLEQNGFRFPVYRKIQDPEDACSFERFPAVIKPSVGGGGSASLYLAQTQTELTSLSAYLLKAHGELIAQEYVGTPESEYTVGVLSDGSGVLINSIAVKRYILSSLGNRIKVRNYSGITKFGPTLAVSSGISQGEIGTFPEVTAGCERISLKLGARYAINIQCRLVDGEVFVFEINPRFSGTTSLRALVGYNEPDILIRKELLGETIASRFHYESGVIMRSLRETLCRSTPFPRGEDIRGDV